MMCLERPKLLQFILHFDGLVLELIVLELKVRHS